MDVFHCLLLPTFTLLHLTSYVAACCPLFLGGVTTLAGSGVAGWSDGVGTVAKFNQPIALAVDTSGTIYVADSLTYRIRVIIGGE